MCTSNYHVHRDYDVAQLVEHTALNLICALGRCNCAVGSMFGECSMATYIPYQSHIAVLANNFSGMKGNNT